MKVILQEAFIYTAECEGGIELKTCVCGFCGTELPVTDKQYDHCPQCEDEMVVVIIEDTEAITVPKTGSEVNYSLVIVFSAAIVLIGAAMLIYSKKKRIK
jgi:LPXTG-motif cell wall-anchored protein